MMDLYDQYSPSLLGNVRAAHTRGWWQMFGFDRDDHIGWESGASRISEVSLSRIPDLLQTEDYAQALLADRPDATAALAALKSRQHRLADTRPHLRLSVVLGESALHREIGGPTSCAHNTLTCSVRRDPVVEHRRATLLTLARAVDEHRATHA